MAPLGECGGATVLEILSADEGAFLIEVVVNRAMQCSELLQTSHSPKPKHRPFSSSKWLVRILGPVVQPPADLPFVYGIQGFQCCAIKSQPIRHDRVNQSVSMQRFPQEFQSDLLVTAFRDEAFEHFALLIDSAPEVVFHAIDFYEDLVEVAAQMVKRTHRLNPAATDLRGKNCTERVLPEPHRLMRDVDAALVQHVLDIPKRDWVADNHHNRQADDFRRRLEVAENAGAAHGDRLTALPASHKPFFF